MRAWQGAKRARHAPVTVACLYSLPQILSASIRAVPNKAACMYSVPQVFNVSRLEDEEIVALCQPCLHRDLGPPSSV